MCVEERETDREREREREAERERERERETEREKEREKKRGGGIRWGKKEEGISLRDVARSSRT